jgi:hypothetical protein
VKVFNGDGVTGEVRSFYAYDSTFSGGVHVAAGDVTADADGRADIVTAAGSNATAHVRVFAAGGGMVREFDAFSPDYAGGAFVAVGRISLSSALDIIVGAGTGGLPNLGANAVEVYSPTGLFRGFPGYSFVPAGGVRVAAADVNNDGVAEVIAGAGEGGGPHLIVADLSSVLPPFVSIVRETYAFDSTFAGGIFVAAATGTGFIGD